MNINFSKRKIELNKKLNSLDLLTINFCEILNKLNINYIIISGYVAILFGRNRASEDIDMFIEKIGFEKFKLLWEELEKKFECLNTSDATDAYKNYLNSKHALRFSKKGEFIPNIEVKFPKVALDEWGIKNKIKILLNKETLYISPLESQIPFKLFLGTEKDIEDAKFLHNLFKDNLDLPLLKEFNQKLKIEEKYNKYLR